jgi:serine/threonine-protein kinase
MKESRGAGHVIAGKYRLVEKLGEGGMGAVWRADHATLGSPVAVKLVNQAQLDSHDGVARFLNEARAAALLRSPHVVQILDHGVDDGVPFMVMELLEGESLAQRLARVGTLSLAETSRILTQVARAVTKAHEAGIVHRDLKPDNIFLVQNDDEELAKVLDFGIAKVAHGLAQSAHKLSTRTGALLGTPFYMSPEQVRGHAVDARTDLWALAIIGFECAVGRVPFDAETVGDLLLQICTEPIPAPSSFTSVPPSFDAWFARGVARPREERFQSARELAEALRAIAADAPAEPAPPAPPLSPERKARSTHAEPDADTLAASATHDLSDPPRDLANAPTIDASPAKSETMSGLATRGVGSGQGKRRAALLAAGFAIAGALVGWQVIAHSRGPGPARADARSTPASGEPGTTTHEAPQPLPSATASAPHDGAASGPKPRAGEASAPPAASATVAPGEVHTAATSATSARPAFVKPPVATASPPAASAAPPKATASAATPPPPAPTVKKDPLAF